MNSWNESLNRAIHECNCPNSVNNGACANPISVDDVTIVLSNNGLGGASAGPDQNACSNALKGYFRSIIY